MLRQFANRLHDCSILVSNQSASACFRVNPWKKSKCGEKCKCCKCCRKKVPEIVEEPSEDAAEDRSRFGSQLRDPATKGSKSEKELPQDGKGSYSIKIQGYQLFRHTYRDDDCSFPFVWLYGNIFVCFLIFF